MLDEILLERALEERKLKEIEVEVAKHYVPYLLLCIHPSIMMYAQVTQMYLRAFQFQMFQKSPPVIHHVKLHFISHIKHLEK
jgi:hypothetical protein